MGIFPTSLSADEKETFARFEAMVEALRYKDGWKFRVNAMQSSPTSPGVLCVAVKTTDSCNEHRQTTIHHTIPIPYTVMLRHDPRQWQRWLMDSIIGIETHEACEFFDLDGEKPFFPSHDGMAAYAVRELRSAEAWRRYI